MAIHLVSSMATRAWLAQLGAAFESEAGRAVRLEAIGGVDAARRVRAGESFDLVVLASDAIDALLGEGHLAGPRVDLAVSSIAVGVPAGAARPDITSADAVKRAVLAAARIGCSTGPSGTHLAKLFEDWGISAIVKDRISIAPPGVPVAALLGRGEVDLGFQQLSELAGDGVDVIGVLPHEIQALTTFSGGVARSSAQPDLARRLLAFLAEPATADVKRRLGMDPA